MPKSFRVGPIDTSSSELFFILGPCVIESEKFVRRIASDLHSLCRELHVPWIFKASYDKANRTSGRSFRGVDVRAGVELLRSIGDELGIQVTTDVHSPAEAEIAAEAIDLLQVPAFLCRQTDLIHAVAVSGRAVNIKKGQFLAPWDIRNIAEKLDAFGCQSYIFTERGVSFGYNNLVADMRSLYWIRELGYPVIFDATHSVQRPGGAGDKTSGDRVLAPVLARAAVAAGCDGIFIETHYDPDTALSDGPNQIPFSQLATLLAKLKQIHEIAR
jgi:2-dehydro-3-deoxyphosphooctonate aldolase (KDO 8-P synthase)